MHIPAKITDERAVDMRCSDDSLIVDLMYDLGISVPMALYPRPHGTTAKNSGNANIGCSGG